MLNIEIKGVQFSNKGAELMLAAILEQLDNELGEYQITLSPGDFLPYQKRARLGAWQKLSFRRGQLDLTGVFAKFPNKLLNFIKRYGIVTERDVDVILDASGFAYGEQWGVKSLAHTAKEIARFKKQNKAYVFLPQALGPFQRPEMKQLAQQVFSEASLVFPRDKCSLQEVQNVLEHHQDHIQQSPDFTCLVEPKPFEKYQNSALKELKKSVCLIPNNKMVSKYHHGSANQDEKNYVEFFIKAGQFYLAQGWQVVLLNHEGVEDQALCEKIQQQLSQSSDKASVEIIQGLSAVDIKAFIGSVDAVISSRFHGCVSALTQGVPCLATSWSHKYQMLFQEYELANNVLDFKQSDDELLNRFNQFNQALIEQKNQCLAHAQVVKQQSYAMWQQVFSVLRNT